MHNTHLNILSIICEFFCYVENKCKCIVYSTQQFPMYNATAVLSLYVLFTCIVYCIVNNFIYSLFSFCIDHCKENNSIYNLL